jgi:hypothetical protein
MLHWTTGLRLGESLVDISRELLVTAARAVLTASDAILTIFAILLAVLAVMYAFVFRADLLVFVLLVIGGAVLAVLAVLLASFLVVPADLHINVTLSSAVFFDSLLGVVAHFKAAVRAVLW